MTTPQATPQGSSAQIAAPLPGRHLLALDWDFHFPNPVEAGDVTNPNLGFYDWGHAESPFFLGNLLWGSRAAGFIEHDIPLPTMLIPDGGWDAFWARFRFGPDAVLYVADSNAYAGMIFPSDVDDNLTYVDPDGAFDSVTLLDAHHDSGYNVPTYADWLQRGNFSCEDWMLIHQQRGTTDLTVRYPQWKPRGATEPIPEGAKVRLTIDDGEPITDRIFDTAFVCRSGAWVPPWCDDEYQAFLDAAPIDIHQLDDHDLNRHFTGADSAMWTVPREQLEAMARAATDQDTAAHD